MVTPLAKVVSILLLGLVTLTMGSIPGFTPSSVQAAPPTHDKNTILCNHDFAFSNSLSETEIQAIFDARNSFFKDYTDPTTGNPASWVIADRAQHYQISSRVLLAKMQAESSSVWAYRDMNQHILNGSGVDMGTRADWVLFFGWSDTTIFPQYKGFYNQVDNAAQSLAAWYSDPDSKGWTVGQPHSVSDGTITPTNEATAALYIYTPWISSNKLLYDVWNMMFGDTGGCQKLDLAFVIDTTGSMWDDIAAVKASATDIANTISSKSTDYRIAVVSYEDFPISPYGDASCGDATFHDVLSFSSDKDAAISGIQGLSLRCGADHEEAVLSALMHTINDGSLGGWRPGVRKVIMQMGDAPPHDPEPFTGLTGDDIVTAAKAGGIEINAELRAGGFRPVNTQSTEPAPIAIFSIAIGSDQAAQDAFQTLAEGTGGKLFLAPTADDVVGAILEAVGDITEPPNSPPNCDFAVAEPFLIWPPNNKFVPVSIVGVVDPDDDPLTFVVSGITQDEPVAGKGHGNKSPDGMGVGTDSASVRAERSGKGNSRVYEISFTASDGLGGECVGSVKTAVPHDQGLNTVPIDDGQVYDSTEEP